MESLSTLANMLPSTTNIPLPLSDILWMVILGFVISFILSIAIGANDVANSFGTSVGAKVLTLHQALFFATIFETLGAVLMGSKVAQTIQKGIFDVEMYIGREETLVLGEISALAGCAVWLFVATAFKMPVSTTHSIVGATLGFHFVVFGIEGIQWLQVGLIVISWITSPVLSGIFSSLIFFILRYFILRKKEPLEPGLRLLPIWYGLVIIVNFFSIFYDGPTTLGFDRIPLWGTFLLSFGSGILVGLAVWFIMVPYIRRKIIGMSSQEEDRAEETQSVFEKKRMYTCHDNKIDQVSLITGAEPISAVDDKAREDLANENGVKVDSKDTERTRMEDGDRRQNESGADGDDTSGRGTSELSEEVRDHPHVTVLCSPLQVLSAIFASFAHGGNDVSNAIGPLIAIWLIYRTGDIAQDEPTPLWVLFYGALGISLGLWLLGRRVIQTVGEDITTLTPSSGFSVELGAAMTVLLASNVGIPISTTHCKIGSVVSVGWLRSREAVNWSLFGTIVLAWGVTLPATMGLSAAIMALLQLAY
eukprot:XP_788312.3 PREDICTED: sodium-dependent phosphate transporter 1-A [Strongylocentrotus purpuratus]